MRRRGPGLLEMIEEQLPNRLHRPLVLSIVLPPADTKAISSGVRIQAVDVVQAHELEQTTIVRIGWQICARIQFLEDLKQGCM